MTEEKSELVFHLEGLDEPLYTVADEYGIGGKLDAGTYDEYIAELDHASAGDPESGMPSRWDLEDEFLVNLARGDIKQYLAATRYLKERDQVLADIADGVAVDTAVDEDYQSLMSIFSDLAEERGRDVVDSNKFREGLRVQQR